MPPPAWPGFDPAPASSTSAGAGAGMRADTQPSSRSSRWGGSRVSPRNRCAARDPDRTPNPGPRRVDRGGPGPGLHRGHGDERRELARASGRPTTTAACSTRSGGCYDRVREPSSRRCPLLGLVPWSGARRGSRTASERGSGQGSTMRRRPCASVSSAMPDGHWGSFGYRLHAFDPGELLALARTPGCRRTACSGRSRAPHGRRPTFIVVLRRPEPICSTGSASIAWPSAAGRSADYRRRLATACPEGEPAAEMAPTKAAIGASARDRRDVTPPLTSGPSAFRAARVSRPRGR